MASSNIKLFDENKGNMLNDTEFNISTQRLNGLQTGVASSQLQNKAMYQTSLVAYAIAQLMLANGVNANDTDAVSAFVGNLSASIVQKVLDKATKQDIENGVSGKWIPSELLKSNNEDLASIYLKLAGGTMLGNLFLNADPTSALQAVTKNYVDSNFAKIQTGSYTGTGTSGQSNPCSLTFGFEPKLLIVGNGSDTADSTAVLIKGMKRHWTIASAGNGTLFPTFSGNTVSWYSNDAWVQMNVANAAYCYLSIG